MVSDDVVGTVTPIIPKNVVISLAFLVEDSVPVFVSLHFSITLQVVEGLIVVVVAELSPLVGTSAAAKPANKASVPVMEIRGMISEIPTEQSERISEAIKWKGKKSSILSSCSSVGGGGHILW